MKATILFLFLLLLTACSSNKIDCEPEIINNTIYINNTIEKECPACQPKIIEKEVIKEVQINNNSYMLKLIQENKRLEASCNISGLEWKTKFENCNNTLSKIREEVSS